MNPEDTGEILQRKHPFLAWVHRNPQLAWALVSAAATALVVGGAAVAIFKSTLSGLHETQDQDRQHLAESLKSISDKVDDLAKNGPTATNANIKALSDRLDKQEQWRDRVEAAAEIRIPKARK